MDKVEKIEHINNEVPRKFHYGLLREDKPLDYNPEEFRQVFMGEYIRCEKDEKSYERDMKDFLMDLYRKDVLFFNMIRSIESKYWDEFQHLYPTGRIHPLEFIIKKHLNELMLLITKILYEQLEEYKNKELDTVMKTVRPIYIDANSLNNNELDRIMKTVKPAVINTDNLRSDKK